MVEENKQEKLRKVLTKIAKNGLELYQLMNDGETIELGITQKPVIVMPNQSPELKCLIITKPVSKIVMNVKQN